MGPVWVCLEIKLLKPSRIELQGQHPALSLAGLVLPGPASWASFVSLSRLVGLYLLSMSAGNSTPTNCYNPTQVQKAQLLLHKGSGFPMGSADTADAEDRRGSNVYEVNTWLWIMMFGRGKSRLGGLTVEEIALKKSAVREEQGKQWRLACVGRRLKYHRNEARA